MIPTIYFRNLLLLLLLLGIASAANAGNTPQGYRDLSSDQARVLIDTEDPLILDVRTPWEFRMGRIANSVLIPVRELRGRLSELTAYRDRDILIYCATGARSVAAAHLLAANGFNRIYNLKRGIHDWARQRFPVVR